MFGVDGFLTTRGVRLGDGYDLGGLVAGVGFEPTTFGL